MSATSKSGIQTTADGTSFIPASKRSDGSTRKEIRVRPGYRPPEDVEKYKNRSAEAWKSRGSGGIPGADESDTVKDAGESKSKNAKRREAAKKKQETETVVDAAAHTELDAAMDRVNISTKPEKIADGTMSERLANNSDTNADAEMDKQKKIRNQLKKLRAVQDLKNKRTNGEKLSHDQLMKIGKEEELLRDLRKLDYHGPEMSQTSESTSLNKTTLG